MLGSSMEPGEKAPRLAVARADGESDTTPTSDVSNNKYQYEEYFSQMGN
jgi:hypothetical protein